MNITPFRAIYPNLSLIASPDSFFSTVKAQFAEYRSSGYFKETEEEAIFVYELKVRGRSHRGIINCTDIGDIDSGKVLKHENTLAAKEQKMMSLMLQNKAMVKPVLLAYDNVEEIDLFISRVIKKSEPFFSVTIDEEGATHTIWKISASKQVKDIAKLFRNQVPKCYIADGHHRVKTSQLLNANSKKNEMVDTRLSRVLTIYFSWDQLAIYDYNRVVDAFQDFSPIRFMAAVSHVCKITALKQGVKPVRKHEMTMLLYGEWYRLRWKKRILEMHQDEAVLFDTHLLNKYIIKDLLRIENVREDQRLQYIDGVVGVSGIESLVSGHLHRVGFCMFPIEVENIKRIADDDKTLPPKSTWFEPRVKNGLLVKGF